MSSTSARETSEIRLVVFDLGRVLVRICDDWQQACSCAGLDVTFRPAEPADQLRLRALANQLEVGEISSTEFATQVARVMGLAPEQVSAASAAYIRGAYPGAAELVADLAASGIATACLTNTNEHHWELLSESGHPSYFPLHRLKWQFASHHLRLRKPDPAIYASVERQTGIAPEAILFFDDVAENVDAARHRGWNVERIDPALDNPIGQMRRALRKFGLE